MTDIESFAFDYYYLTREEFIELVTFVFDTPAEVSAALFAWDFINQP